MIVFPHCSTPPPPEKPYLQSRCRIEEVNGVLDALQFSCIFFKSILAPCALRLSTGSEALQWAHVLLWLQDRVPSQGAMAVAMAGNCRGCLIGKQSAMAEWQD